MKHSQGEQSETLDGNWLRKERERLAMGRPQIAAALLIPLSRLVSLETQNKLVPREWMPKIHALGLRVPESALAAVIPESTQQIDELEREPTRNEPKRLSGSWLRANRSRLKFYLKYIAEKLGLTPRELADVETDDEPLEPEWLPTLEALGFPIKQQASTDAGQAACSPEMAP